MQWTMKQLREMTKGMPDDFNIVLADADGYVRGVASISLARVAGERALVIQLEGEDEVRKGSLQDLLSRG